MKVIFLNSEILIHFHALVSILNMPFHWDFPIKNFASCFKFYSFNSVIFSKKLNDFLIPGY